MPQEITDFLKTATHGSLYQGPDWQHAVERTDGKHLVLCAVRNGRPRFGATVYKSAIPGTSYFVGSVRRGPVFDQPGDAIRLWTEFEAQLYRERAIALTVSPYWEIGELQALRTYLKELGYKPSRRDGDYCCTATIDLSKPLEEIYNGMHRDGRRELRKAARKGVQVRRAEGRADWQVLWGLTQETGRRKGIDVPSLEKFEAMRCFAETSPLHCIAILGCLAGHPIAAAAVLRHGTTVTPEVAGSSSVAIQGVSKFLPIMWESIQWAKQTGASRFDVGGMTAHAPKGSALWRINMFKKQLSGREIELFRPMEKVFHPALYKAYTLLRASKRKALGRYRSIVRRAT